MRGEHSRSFYAILFILLPALLLGAALRYIVQEQWKEDTFAHLRHNAQVLSDTASAYYAEGSLNNILFAINLDLSAEVSDVDTVVCNRDGQILLCSDSPTGCKHRGIIITTNYLDRVITAGGICDTAHFRGLYEEERHIAAAPIYSRQSGEAVGIVLVSIPVDANEGLLNSITLSFVVMLALVLLFTALSLWYFGQRHEHPLREMAKTTAAFGHGDLDARVHLKGSYPEEVEELALSINNMASSLQKSEYSRQEFVANVSHELKTPLAVMQNYAMLLQQPELSEEDRIRYAKGISEACCRLSGLITNILKMSKLENQQIYPATSDIVLDEQLCECLLTFENVWESKEIEIETDIAEEVRIAADPELLSLVWNNLFSNAFKFTDNGGKVSVSMRTEGEYAVVSVSDTGCGMTPEVGKHIFEKFYQGDTSHATQGNGLGLALVRRVVDIMGGDIDVSSEVGVGSTFTVRLRRRDNGSI